MAYVQNERGTMAVFGLVVEKYGLAIATLDYSRLAACSAEWRFDT
jgi:hypothetical protein